MFVQIVKIKNNTTVLELDKKIQNIYKNVIKINLIQQLLYECNTNKKQLSVIDNTYVYYSLF